MKRVKIYRAGFSGWKFESLLKRLEDSGLHHFCLEGRNDSDKRIINNGEKYKSFCVDIDVYFTGKEANKAIHGKIGFSKTTSYNYSHDNCYMCNKYKVLDAEMMHYPLPRRLSIN